MNAPWGIVLASIAEMRSVWGEPAGTSGGGRSPLWKSRSRNRAVTAFTWSSPSVVSASTSTGPSRVAARNVAQIQ
jgi:hypothetical protein